MAGTDAIGAGSAQAKRGGKMARKKVRAPWLERYSALLLAAVLLGAWQAAVPLAGLSEFVLPTPLAIATRIVGELPLLANHAYVTLFEVVSGFAMAVLIGIPLAFVNGGVKVGHWAAQK